MEIRVMEIGFHSSRGLLKRDMPHSKQRKLDGSIKKNSCFD